MRIGFILVLLAAPAAAADPPVAPVVATLGSLERKLTGYAAAFAVHAGRATALSSAGDLTTWDVTTGRRVSHQQLAPAGDEVRAAAISADGRWVYVRLARGGLVQHDTRTNRTATVLAAAQAQNLGWLNASADGTTLASTDSDPRSRADGTVFVVWDCAAGAVKERQQIPATDYSQSWSLSPDGRRLAYQCRDARPADEKKPWAVRLLDAETGEPIRTFGHHPWSFQFYMGDFSTDGSKLPTYDPREGTRVWDTATGGLVREWAPPVGGGISTLAPDGRHVLVGAAEPREVSRLCDLATGATVRTFPIRPGYDRTAVLPDSKGVVSFGYDRVFRVWDTATGTERFPVVGHAGDVTGLAWLPDGTGVVSGGDDGTVRVWRLSDAAETTRLPSPKPRGERRSRVVALAVNRDGSAVAVGGWDGGLASVRVWDRARNRVAGSPASTAIFPDTTFMFSGAVISLSPEQDPQRIQQLAFNPGTNGCRALAGNKLLRLSAAAQPLGGVEEMPSKFVGGTVALTRGEPLISLEAGLGVACYSGDGADELRVWDFETKAVRAAAPLAKNARLTAVAITPNGRLVVMAVGTSDSLRLFDGNTLAEVGRLPNALRVAAISKDGRLCAAWTGESGRFTVFDLARGTPLAVVPAVKLPCVAFAPDGRRVATGGFDSRIYVHDLRAAIDPTPPAFDAAACWADLASADGATATRAVYRLGDHPAGARKLFREKLPPAAKPAAADVAEWMAALDAPAFADRQAAKKSLLAVGDVIEPELRQEVAKNPSPAAVQSLAAVLAAVARSRAKLDGDHLRAYRVVQVLEMIVPPAADLLAAYAAGAKGAFLTLEAAAARGRAR